MRTRRLVVVACAVLCAPSLAAQSSQCAAQPVNVRDACQRGTDVFTMLAPQLSGALAGGGATLGTARTVDGLGVTLRVNGIRGDVPDLSSVPFSAAGLSSRAIATTRSVAALASLDLALSVVPGFRAGPYRILSADVLASVVHNPMRELGAFAVRASGGRVKTGFGVRVGLIEERAWMPAVSVSFQRRAVPNTTLATGVPVNASAAPTPDSLALAEMSLRVDAYRVAVSKRVGFMELGGGVGQDRARHFAQLRTRVTPVVLSSALTPVSSAYVLTQSLTRQSAYGTVGVNVGRFHLGAEAGAVFGGDTVQVYNSFPSVQLDAARPYASLGLRYRL